LSCGAVRQKPEADIHASYRRENDQIMKAAFSCMGRRQQGQAEAIFSQICPFFAGADAG
jgi:hypothetical protein